MKKLAYLLVLPLLSGCLMNEMVSATKRCPTAKARGVLSLQSNSCKASLNCQLRIFGPDAEDSSSVEDFGGISVKVFSFNTAGAIQRDGISELVDGVSDYLRAEAVCSTSAGRSEIVGKTSQPNELVNQAIEAVYKKCAEKGEQK